VGSRSSGAPRGRSSPSVQAKITSFHISVRDDGAGGANPTEGSGLVGLKDRVETGRHDGGGQPARRGDIAARRASTRGV